MRIALLSPTGYLTAELGGELQPKRGLVTANRQAVGAWETWTVEPLPNNTFALKSCNGFYLCAEAGGGSTVHANRPKIGAWETFRSPGPMTESWTNVIQTNDGQHFLSVSAIGDHVVDAVALTGTPFVIEVIDGAEPVPPSGSLSRLTRIDRSRHRMIDEHGTPVYGRGASMFLLYKKYLDGEDVTPQLQQLKGLGCNLIRVMGMFESLGGFNPKAYPDYYTRIVPFVQLCASFGIYVLWTACAATGAYFNDDEAYEHIRKSRDECKKAGTTIFSPVNEQGQHNNSIPRERVCRELVNAGTMGDTLYDTGSFGMDIPCAPPFGTHAVLHVNRRYSNSIRDCCILDNPNYVNDGLEVGLDEPARYGTTNDPNGDGDRQHARDAAGTAYTALFFIYHSLEGERGNVLTGNTLDCAVDAFGAMPS